MANRDKLKLNRRELLFFVLPFIILSLLIGSLGHFNAIRRIDDISQVVKDSTVDIADSYAQMLVGSHEMNTIIDSLMEEKLLSVGEAVLLLKDEEINSDELKEIAGKFNVWRINLFNGNGEIVASNDEGNVGWKSHEGHPVQEFMQSNQENFIEDLREGSINNYLFKFGYIRGRRGHFVQVGIESNDYQKFSKNYQAEKLIEKILERDHIIHVLLIDMDSRIIASSMELEPGFLVESKEINKHLSSEGPGVDKYSINGRDSLHAYSPMIIDGNKIGVLSIIWDTYIIDDAIREIIVGSIKELGIIIIILGAILYYAYRKDKSNIRIAYYDKLTGLPNREYLNEFINNFTQKNISSSKAVFFINLINFKLLNMAYGYIYGDQILVQVADKIKGLLGTNSRLFRFNADRFILLIEDYEDKLELENLAKTIIEKNIKPLGGKHRLEYLDFEIVIMEIDKDRESLDEILKHTSFALSNNTDSSRQVVFYNEGIRKRKLRENLIEEILEDIIDGRNRESFYLEFQPKLDIELNKIVGFESLARIRHSELGLIPPNEFIELAEKRMLIYDLGNIIFEMACDFLKSLEALGYKEISISINVSAMQILRDEFVEDIKKIARKTSVDMSMLELEITESLLIDNFELINEKLREIKNLGMSISIDDFGTGFSSFSRLRSLNVDIVKIDKYFIDNILLEDENRLISRDIISMAHRLGLLVVAEGVEEEKQLNYLKKYGCDIAQGYLISKPLSKESAIEQIK